MQNILVKILIWVFKGNLTLENRGKLLNLILDKLALLPLHNVIEFENGSLKINGKVLDFEETNLIRNSAKLAISNRAERLIEDQVLYEAMTYSVNGTTNFDQLYSAKMAVWWGQRRHKLLKELAESPDLAGS